jgi:uncharacterized protein YecE (DUF72 family)
LGEVEIGTSGWSYAEWEGVFYPPKEIKKLTYYSKFFRTAEIDSTFYAYPNKGTVLGWVKNTPPGFTFTAKIPKLITHEKKLDPDKGVAADFVRFLDVLKPLIVSQKLALLLLQLPPKFTFDEDYDRLKRFIENSPTDVKLAVEFRHPSWLRDEVWDLLKSNKISNTIVDEPLLPPDTIVTSETALVRWHGRGERPWYNYRYGDEELEAWKPKLKEISEGASKVYGYFNNHFHGFAIENALKTLEKLGQTTPEQRALLERVTNKLENRDQSRDSNLLEFVDETTTKKKKKDDETTAR